MSGRTTRLDQERHQAKAIKGQHEKRPHEKRQPLEPVLKRDCVRFLKCVGASSFPRRSTSRPRRKCNADSRGGVGAALALEIRLDDCHHQQIHVAHLHNSLKSLVVENSAWNYGTELSDPDAICFIRMKTSPCTQISRSGPSLGTRGELTISPLILPWWYQIPTQCKRPKVLLVHALPRGHLSSSPDALLPILSSRPPQLCQLRHARLLPPPTGDSIQTLRLRWPCPQTLRAAERVDVQRSARALNRSPHYAEPCRLRPLVRLAFDPLTVMWFPPAGRWR